MAEIEESSRLYEEHGALVMTAVVISGAAEGRPSRAPVTFVLTLSRPSGQNVTVNYATTDGTASAAAGDYVARAGTVTFGPGSTTQTVTITLNADALEEQNETFYLDLIAVTNGVLLDDRGLALVIDDDFDVG